MGLSLQCPSPPGHDSADRREPELASSAADVARERQAMKKLAIGIGALSGALLTAPLLGVMYLGDKLAGMPFIPFDLLD